MLEPPGHAILLTKASTLSIWSRVTPYCGFRSTWPDSRMGLIDRTYNQLTAQNLKGLRDQQSQSPWADILDDPVGCVVNYGQTPWDRARDRGKMSLNSRSRWTAVGIAATTISVLLPIASSSGLDQSEVAVQNPVILAGSAPENLSGLTVTIVASSEYSAELEEGDQSPTLRLDESAVEWGSGAYSVRVGLDELPTWAVGEDGTVTLVVDAIRTNGAFFETTHSAIAVIAADGSQRWVDPQSTAAASSDTYRPVSGRANVRVLTVSKLHLAVPRADKMVKLTKLNAAKSGIRPTGSARLGCDLTEGSTLIDKDVRWADIGSTYPVGNTEARVAISSAKNFEYGVAVKAVGSASFEASGSRSISTGWSKAWNFNQVDARVYRKQVEYGKYQNVLVTGVWPWLACLVSYSWRPITETGGEGFRAGTVQNFTVCVPVTPGLWSREQSNGQEFNISGGVDFDSIIGLDLSVARQYSETQRTDYRIKGPRDKRMCGNGAYPSIANSVMERFR